MENIIKITKLCKQYGDTIVFEKAELKIPRNSFFAITGVSGSGKTTLLNIISLLDYPQEGEYVFNGKEIDWREQGHHATIRNQHMGFIFQSYNLLPKMSVKDNICLPLFYRNKKIDMESIYRISSRLSISKLLGKDVEALSGGEKQRVAIARALVTNPEIIICDEPTGNLDEANANDVLTLLEEEKKKGKTIIFVTHSNNFERYYTEHVFLLNHKINDYKL